MANHTTSTKTGLNNEAITKKGTPSGESAAFNELPPGEDISKQSHSDLGRTAKMRVLRWDGKQDYK